MNPYIGDRQLEPDDDSYQCPYCGALRPNNFALSLHVKSCPVRAATEEPAGDDG